MKNIITIISILCLALTVQAQTLSGFEVMKKNKDMLYSNSEQVNFTMELINKKGKKRTRSLTQYSKTDQEDNRSTLLRFYEPADVSGVGFLAIENTDRDDDQWLYLPALGRSRRISASDEKDNFMGSDFTYEDIGTEDIDEFKYTLLKDEVINDSKCYVVEAIPSREDKIKKSGYSKRTIYIDKKTYLVVKTLYYDSKNELSKVYTASAYVQDEKSKKWRTTSMNMKNLKSNHSTNLFFNEYQINCNVDNTVFSQRYLESVN